MSAFYLLLPIGIPIVLGALLTLPAKRSVKALRICVSVITLAVSALTWWMIAKVGAKEAVLMEITEHFVLKLQFDGLGRFFAGIVATLWPLTVCYAFEYLKEDRRQGIFFTFFTMAYGVTLGVSMSGNLFTLYCFYELLTLSTVPLVHHTQTPDAVRAARTYFLYSLGGAALAFVSMLYASLGKIGTEAAAVSCIFWLLGFFGFGVKAAVFPTHLWLPRASVAPTPVTALLHAVAVVKSGVFAIIRLTNCAYGADLLKGSPAVNIAIAFAIFTILFGAVMALKETHFKRRLAYSTVDNLSYIIFGILLLTEDGLSAGLLHMAFHAEIKILAFFAAGAVLHKTGVEYNKDLDGMGRRMKLTFVCYSAAALALTGIPPFSGFVSKWYLLTAGAQSGTVMAYIGTGVIIASALLTALYMLSPMVHAWFPYKSSEKAAVNPAASEGKTKTVNQDPGFMMTVPMAILAVGILMTGLYADKIRAVTDGIASSVTLWR